MVTGLISMNVELLNSCCRSSQERLDAGDVPLAHRIQIVFMARGQKHSGAHEDVHLLPEGRDELRSAIG